MAKIEENIPKNIPMAKPKRNWMWRRLLGADGEGTARLNEWKSGWKSV
jgi:hypothetical protein